MTEELAKKDYAHVSSWLAFRWMCSECKGLNSISWDDWVAYKGVAECFECEKAHRVTAPWA